MNCYKILRIPQNSSPEEIENAADRMTSIWNPEDFDDYREVALCVLDDIKTAKHTLLNCQSRKLHDEKLKELYSESNDCAEQKVEIRSHSGVSGFYIRPWVQSSEAQDGKFSVNQIDLHQLNDLTTSKNLENEQSTVKQIDLHQPYDFTATKHLENEQSTVKQIDLHQPNDLTTSKNLENDQSTVKQLDLHQPHDFTASKHLENGQSTINQTDFYHSTDFSISKSLEDGQSAMNQADFNQPNDFSSSTPKNFDVHQRKTYLPKYRSFDNVTSGEVNHYTSHNKINSSTSLGNLPSSFETRSSENQSVDKSSPENDSTTRKSELVDNTSLSLHDSRCEVVDLTPQFIRLKCSEESGSPMSNALVSGDVFTNSVAQNKTPASGFFDATEGTVKQCISETNDTPSSGDTNSTVSASFLAKLGSMRRKLHEIEYSLDVQLSHFRKCVSDTDIASELFGSGYEDTASPEGNVQEGPNTAARKSLSDSDCLNFFRRRSSSRPNGAMVNDLSRRYAENIMKSSDDKGWMYGGKFGERSEDGKGVDQPSNGVRSPVTQNDLNGRSKPPTERNIVGEDERNVSSSDNNDSQIDANGVITLETNIRLEDDVGIEDPSSSSSEASSENSDSRSADEQSFFNRDEDTVAIGITKSKTKSVSDGKSLTCSSVLKVEKSLGSSPEDFLRNECSVLKGFVKASFESVFGMLISRLGLEDFSLSTKSTLNREGEEVKIYIDGKLLLTVENDVVHKHGGGYLESKCISTMPLSMITIINTKNMKFKIVRFIGEKREFIQLYKNDILSYVLENTYSDNLQSRS